MIHRTITHDLIQEIFEYAYGNPQEQWLKTMHQLKMQRVFASIEDIGEFKNDMDMGGSSLQEYYMKLDSWIEVLMDEDTDYLYSEFFYQRLLVSIFI